MCGAEMDEILGSPEKYSGEKKVGIMGGTFDPIHNAHLALGECARVQMALDEVWFMPAKDPYFKKKKNVTPAKFRAEMTALAVKGHEGFKMSDFELLREGETYTAETLQKLNELYPDIHFYFIIGSDSMYQLETWWHPEIIMKHATLVVAEREYPERVRSFMDQVEYLRKKFGADIRVLDFEESDISSTMIREMAAKGEDLSELLPDAVSLYIGEHGLYK
ncbi:nicotinate-nucleotide adenylyltransferase [Oribacterium sp. P6A1]|uniref:nicotinate-nucleotide adenylyltransferase n=1 Tax=Oribacterium sp. P6A1 TaxID=1410612 RepID=UPI000A543DE0|nr:nicotinate-nucleotide adenylyltransferase [Oribacterium sp. P6A1]